MVSAIRRYSSSVASAGDALGRSDASMGGATVAYPRTPGRSVGSDAPVLDHAPVALPVGVDAGLELRGRASHCDRALLVELVSDVGAGRHSLDVFRDLVDHRSRR